MKETRFTHLSLEPKRIVSLKTKGEIPLRVSVSCPTKFHSFYLADQLHRHGSLKSLYTSYYGSWGKKRNDLGIDIPIERVHTHLASALLYYGYNPGTHLFRSHFYGKWVARQLSDEDMVVTWGLSALPIIERAHQLGMIAIVERGSSHATYQRDILIEEYEKWGKSTVNLHRSFTQARMDQELLEYELADYISIPSSFVERTFLEQGISKDKLIKVPYGVNITDFKQLPKQDNIFRVVFSGSMSLRKGVHYLLQAFAELNLSNAELWLLGGKLVEIDYFFKKYEGAFRWFGQLPQEKLHKYYSQCSVFVINSVEDGFGMVVPQGMACGLPAICSPNVGANDLIEDGKEGFIVPISDVESLKTKILYLYEHQDICYEMGQAAKCKIQHGYTWDDYGEKMMCSYQKVLENTQCLS